MLEASSPSSKFAVAHGSVPALTSMDPFTESELFDEDVPAASPLSIEEPIEALRPSTAGGWSALAAMLARRWPACVAGLLVALLAVGLLSGVSSTRPQASALDRAHRHDSRHRRHGRRVNHQRSTGKLRRVSARPSGLEVSAESRTASDMPPSPVVPRPIRVGLSEPTVPLLRYRSEKCNRRSSII
jgi:hypothetical protein